MTCIDNDINFSSSKIKSEKQLVLLVDQLKTRGKTIGFCVGSYDLLHPGHMKHFESAKELCDVLIVGVTSDYFVRKRKGKGRPIISEQLRAYSISQLASVDYVVISSFERATDLIHSLKPSYYIKGSDYRNKKTLGITAERKAIKEVKGEMKYTHDRQFSTTDLISKTQKRTDKPVLVLGAGRPGVGQSTLLKAFAKKNGFMYIDKDIIGESYLITLKNDIFLTQDSSSCSSEYLSGIKYKTYYAMLQLARNNLSLGFNVVLDGHFDDKLSIPFINDMLTCISKNNVVVKVYFTCSKEIMLDRLKQRHLDRGKMNNFKDCYKRNKDDDISLFDIVFDTKGDISVNVDSLSHEIMNKVCGD